MIPLAAAAVLTASCSEFLDDQPEGTTKVEDTDYSNSELIFQSISASYASMRHNGAHGFPYINLCEITSDDADKGSTASDGPASKAMDEFTYGPSSNLVSEAWTGYYNIVSAANFAISEMPKFAEAQKSDDNKLVALQCLGEAKAMRAYAYFNLVRLFGNVPIQDRTYTADEINSLPQATREQTYNFIINDLWYAVNNLPESYTPAYKWAGRITKYTAMGILAKVYLYKPDYDSAAYYTDKIIASGKFDLLPSYRTAFRSAGENSIESLFEIQSSTIGKSTGATADVPILEYGFYQGPRDNKPANMQGWGFCTPSQNLADFLNGRGDSQRAEVIFMQRGTTYEGAQILATCPNEYYNGKVFSPASENVWSFNGYSFDYNVRILRYADILLIHAEALTRGVGTAITSGMTADQAMNKVRGRAGLSTPGGYTLQQIKDERRAEMAMEEDRFLDLVRTGDAVTVLASKGFTANKNELFPIPSSVRQVNQGLVQNPGYTQ